MDKIYRMGSNGAGSSACIIILSILFILSNPEFKQKIDVNWSFFTSDDVLKGRTSNSIAYETLRGRSDL
jgi:hypothetical protein